MANVKGLLSVIVEKLDDMDSRMSRIERGKGVVVKDERTSTRISAKQKPKRITDSDGTFELNENGYYVLVEKAKPKGYAQAKARVEHAHVRQKSSNVPQAIVQIAEQMEENGFASVQKIEQYSHQTWNVHYTLNSNGQKHVKGYFVGDNFVRCIYRQ